MPNGSLGKKSARELRQRESDYRCCIPALAGFVSPQSIAPDGMETFRETRAGAITISQTPFDRCAFVCSYRAMQCLWLIVAFVICSCATPANRRDLYRPERNYEPALQTTTTSATTRVRKTKTITRPEPEGPITPDEEPVLPPP
jgi:hypothetical protein